MGTTTGDAQAKPHTAVTVRSTCAPLLRCGRSGNGDMENEVSAKKPKAVTASLGMEAGSLETRTSARRQRPSCDEAPPRHESADTHPNPYDYILAGLAACTLVPVWLSTDQTTDATRQLLFGTPPNTWSDGPYEVSLPLRLTQERVSRKTGQLHNGNCLVSV